MRFSLSQSYHRSHNLELFENRVWVHFEVASRNIISNIKHAFKPFAMIPYSTYAQRNSYMFEITNLAKFHFKAFNFRSFLMHFLPVSLLPFHFIASHFHFISVSVLLILLFYGFNEANIDIKFQHIFMRCTLYIRERIVFFASAHIMCG